MIDLHTHSSASDGTYGPSQLIDYAAQKNLTALALTDHDTVDGILEAQEQAHRCGIAFIPGIEISVEWPTGEFHLLGLGLKTLSPELAKLIRFLRAERDSRNRKIAKKLREQHISITYEEVAEKAGTNTVGRPHFASILAEKGIVKERKEAFDRFLAKGRPCYVSRTGADLKDAVNAIKTSGGIPVQAHPLSMYVSWGKMEEMLADIRAQGVEGLEAYHPAIRRAESARLESLAKKLGMIATAGSDFHGKQVRADREIGFTAGDMQIEDRFWLAELQPALEKIHSGTDHSFAL